MSDEERPVEITVAWPTNAPSPGLLVEQARMLVQLEEQRFAAQQSQATTLLAVVGVIASIGSGLFAVFNGRDFKLAVVLLGQPISLILIAVVLIGFFGVVLGLLQAGRSAIGVMEQKSNLSPKLQTQLVKDQFPEMLHSDSAVTSKVVLGSLAGELKAAQTANAAVRVNLERLSWQLARAVVSGLIVAALMLAGTSGHSQKVEVINAQGENVVEVQRGR